MPQIIVTAGDAASLTEGTVTLNERINATDFESDRFAANLIERLGWAVSDAVEVEHREVVPQREIDEREIGQHRDVVERLEVIEAENRLGQRPSASVVTTAS